MKMEIGLTKLEIGRDKPISKTFQIQHFKMSLIYRLWLTHLKISWLKFDK
jgi:hypothetical protein